MNKLGITLQNLRKNKKITQEDVAVYIAKKTGKPLTRKAVAKWESEETMPSAIQFLYMCRLYEVQDIMHTFGGKNSLGLNRLGQERVEEYTKLLLSQKKFRAMEKKKNLRYIPLFDIAVSAGTGQFLDSDASEEIEVDAMIPPMVDYALRISGDSMEPRFIDGQIVYVQKQNTLQYGEIGIFALNEEAYIKKLEFIENSPALVSLNAAYAPLHIQKEDKLYILGKVIM